MAEVVVVNRARGRSGAAPLVARRLDNLPDPRGFQVRRGRQEATA